MSSDTQDTTPPPVDNPCWIEIPARDVAKLKDFYASLFPSWEWRPASDEYPETNMALYSFKGPKGLGGGIVKMPENCGPHNQSLGSGFTVYYFVDSLEKAEARVHELGGKTVLEKKAESTHGWFMNVTDVEGNRFGLYELAPGMGSG